MTIFLGYLLWTNASLCNWFQNIELDLQPKNSKCSLDAFNSLKNFCKMYSETEFNKSNVDMMENWVGVLESIIPFLPHSLDFLSDSNPGVFAI